MNKQILAIILLIALVCSVPVIMANSGDLDVSELHHNLGIEDCLYCHNLAFPDGWDECNNCHGSNDPYDDDRGKQRNRGYI